MPKLSEELKNNTASIHVEAENSIFVKKLLSGQLSVYQYQYYLTSLLPLYQALESYLCDNMMNKFIQPLVLPELFRSKKIISDLNGITQITGCAIPIDDYTISDPLEAISIFYVRYFGDVSGGQIMCKKLLKTHYELKNMMSFYDFKDSSNKTKKLILLLRSKLDQIELSVNDVKRVINYSQKFFYTL